MTTASNADLQVELDFFSRVPEILEDLESVQADRLAAGAHALAVLLDDSAGYQAMALGELMRDCGGVELIAGLFDGRELENTTLRLLLMGLGNICSSAVDANASASREVFGQCDIVRRLRPHLTSKDRSCQLYAAAAFQNLLHSPALAWEALRLGVHRTLDAMCAPSQPDVLRHFAAGALINIDMVASKPSASGRSPVSALRGSVFQSIKEPRSIFSASSEYSLSAEARAAVAWRQQKESSGKSSQRLRRWRKQKVARAPAACDAGGGAVPPTPVDGAGFSAAPPLPQQIFEPGAACDGEGVEAGGGDDELAEQLQLCVVTPPTQELLQTRIPLANSTGDNASRGSRGSDNDSSWGSFLSATSWSGSFVTAISSLSEVSKDTSPPSPPRHSSMPEAHPATYEADLEGGQSQTLRTLTQF